MVGAMTHAFVEPVDRDIWVASGTIVDFQGFPYPTRMVVVRLNRGWLWL